MTDDAADWRAWAKAAMNLLTSAQVLWNERARFFPRDAVAERAGPDHCDIASPSETSGWMPFDHGPTFLMLGGLSLEALSKAVIVQREARAQGGTVAALPREYMVGHRVRSLIETVGITLTHEEGELADRLQTYVSWAGRYPLPKPRQPLADLIVRDDDFDTLNAVYRRLDSLLRTPAP